MAWALVGRGLDLISGEVEPVDWLIDHLEPLTIRGDVSNRRSDGYLFTGSLSYSEDDPVSTAASHLRHLDMPWTRPPTQARQDNRRSDRMITLLNCLLSIMGSPGRSGQPRASSLLASILRTAPLIS